MQPGADVLQWVQLGVVGENDATPTKPAWLLHDWTPVTEQPLKVSSTWAVAPSNITGDIFLRSVNTDNVGDLIQSVCARGCLALLVFVIVLEKLHPLFGVARRKPHFQVVIVIVNINNALGDDRKTALPAWLNVHGNDVARAVRVIEDAV